MAIIGGEIGFKILKSNYAGSQEIPVDQYDECPQAKLQTHFGMSFFEYIRDKKVIDFGSGLGRESVEIATTGALQVIGLEIQDRFRLAAEHRALKAGVSDICSFVSQTDEQADLVFSLDSFEHFDDPASILETMSDRLKVNGEVWISFGLPWFHPYGGHLFSVFPWAHLVFTEKALLRWRAEFKDDGAKRFHEIAGGLNKMTIRKFEGLVENSSLKFEEFRTTPINAMRFIHCGATRKFSTTLIFARLKKRSVV